MLLSEQNGFTVSTLKWKQAAISKITFKYNLIKTGFMYIERCVFVSGNISFLKEKMKCNI